MQPRSTASFSCTRFFFRTQISWFHVLTLVLACGTFLPQSVVAQTASQTPPAVVDGTAKLVQPANPSQRLRVVLGLERPHPDEEEVFLNDQHNELFFGKDGLILGGQYLVRKIVERVVGFRRPFLGTQNQPDWRVFTRFHPVLAGVVEVEVHLPSVRVAEFANLEIDDDQAAQLTVEENEIDAKPSVVDAKPALATEEGEVVARLQEEVCEVLDERYFQI
jgi:hypothetical protein